jgi:hypothetical protein
MNIFLRASLGVVTTGLAIFAWAQAPESTQTPQTTSQSEPQSASSPHQRQSTTTSANEAANPSETDPSASSTQHQQETTRTRTAQGADEQDPRMKECVDRVKEKNKGIPDYTARKACREHLKDQGDKKTSEG